ncbi:hypothetical protein ABFS82_12G031000 [Erythranthe guttata]|nr:PREDICTED: uncharacterized protein LOC105961308 [Erythranthe guttata]|eukprot:XP_012840995.1 PREDICTED: uncharacterized protein LOC105961308 [Erythranthe guttata]
MNETSEKSNPSLAIVEKKPQRGGGAGGCVGIFFQLFDWNRRFAKNKLFSKKLLNPPVRLKQASKKYGGDEKQPKLRLIADENSGGFPSSKNNNIEQKHEMRVPGLVARLMGLESMPSLHREKSKKFLASSSLSSKTEKLADTNIYVKEELMNVEKGCNSNNSKQESRPQKLQKTSVCENRPINRFGTEKLPFKDVLSKPKKHHPKLPSPVKSPRNLSRKSSSKLISAATRILEPGLQSKCAALTYSNNLTDKRAPSRSDGCDCFAANEHSCGNCGYLLRDLDSKPSIVDEQQPLIFGSPFSRCVGPPSCQESERSKYEDNPAVVFPFLGDNLQSRVELSASNNGPFGGNTRRNPEQWKAPNYMRSQTSQRSKLTRNNGKFEMEKQIVSSLKEESGPPLGRKRRPMKGESSGGFTTSKQPGGYNSHFTKNRNEPLHMQDDGEVDNGVASFKFNSSAKQRSGNAERKVRSNLYFDDGRRAKLENAAPPPLSGDALGAILEQKLKELNNVQREDNITGQKKTTATILQELIYALTSEIPFQHDNLPALPDRRNSWRDNTRFYSSASSTDFQANATTMKQYVDPPLESEHLSPGSVLEAYYSNESCVSSNLDDNLGYNGPHLPNPNSHFSDFKNPILDILTNVSEILCCKNLASYGLKGDKFDHAKKVLTDAELAFHTSALSSSVVGRGSPIKHLLVDELETLASILWLNYGCTLGIEDGVEANQLRRFGLDAVIEYLDQRFDFYSKMTRKLVVGPVRMNTNTMMFEIVEAVRKWEEVSRFVLDELVEKELSCTLGEWTEFESQVFESGVEISGDVLQVLVDEIVVDLSKW